MVLLTVMGPTKDFFSTIMEYLSGSPLSLEEAARPYIEASTELVYIWFAWAVPPAIVAGYLLHKFHGMVVNRNEKENHDWKPKMAEYGSIVGLVLLSTSFVLAFYGHYTYLIIPTYALLFFVTILFLPKLLSSPNEFVKMITVSILAVSLFIGSSSPNWAPIENPYFPARRRLYHQVVYTSEFGQNLPQNVTLILDFDAYPDIPEGINVRKPGSYRVIRGMLLRFERGVSINDIAFDDSYIFIVRFGRLVMHRGDMFNLVRTSGKHAMITPVHYLLDEA
jgi:hypothetical protein